IIINGKICINVCIIGRQHTMIMNGTSPDSSMSVAPCLMENGTYKTMNVNRPVKNDCRNNLIIPYSLLKLMIFQQFITDPSCRAVYGSCKLPLSIIVRSDLKINRFYVLSEKTQL